MTKKTAKGIGAAVAAVAAAAIAVALVLNHMKDPGKGPGGSTELGQQFKYDDSDARKVDPSLIRWRQAATIQLDLPAPRAIAVSPQGVIYVGGGQVVQSFTSDLVNVGQVILDTGGPDITAMACDEEGTLYVAQSNFVCVLDKSLSLNAQWESLGDQVNVTSLAVRDGDVYLADSAGRCVLRCDLAGAVLGRIGGKDAPEGSPSFIVPSPSFDLALGGDSLLRVVNPGRLRVEAITADGHSEFHWGSQLRGIEGFIGCCNPAHIAILPDGRVVTSEKGVSRVKVYGPDLAEATRGRLDGVAAAPDQLSKYEGSMDVATDASGRILLLDPGAKLVRVYEELPAGGTQTQPR